MKKIAVALAIIAALAAIITNGRTIMEFTISMYHKVIGPRNLITVLDVKNESDSRGKHFDFEATDMDRALGYPEWAETNVWASKTLDGPRRLIWIVRGSHGGSTNACGRYKDNPRDGDWKTYDKFYVFSTP